MAELQQMSRPNRTQEIEDNSLPQFSLKALLGITTATAFLSAVSQLPYDFNLELPVVGWVGHKGVKLGSLMVVIFVARFFIIRVHGSPRHSLILYGILLLATLPYIYYCKFWGFRGPVGKFLGEPIGIFAVPTCSFLLLDIKRRWCTPGKYFLRSIVELYVFAIWAVIWAYFGAIVGWNSMFQ
jgi:hypothetical protein